MPPPLVFEPEVVRLPLALEIFLTAWFFCVGGCIGSFMNVVIYRLPRRKSVVSPASRCPQCGSAIRSYDNLPILSWLLLGGRCRDCRAPISVRYPVVELIIALIFMGMAVQAFIPGGPWWLLNIVPGMLLSIDWPQLALAYIHYMLLVCTLVCAAYIAWDGLRVPRRLFVPALVVGALVSLYWNEVRPLAGAGGDRLDTLLQGVRDGVTGAALGLVVGLTFDVLLNLRDATGEPRGQIRLALATCGWMLGAKAIPLIAFGAAVLALVWFATSGRRWRSASSAPLIGIAAMTTALVLAGRLAFERWPLLGLSEPALGALAAVALVATAALLRFLAPLPEIPAEARPLPDPSPDVMYP